MSSTERTQQSATERVGQKGERQEVPEQNVAPGGPSARTRSKYDPGDVNPGEYIEDESIPSRYTRADAAHDEEGVETSLAEEGQNVNRVHGGYKASLKNPNVSQEAKDRAEELLKEDQAL
ncbi:hypothetical protein AX16_004707 [Volvariella volvacea WC 439]|nr:hypothetical protein AX16_004707 [Volvariella volvacea WC 439]